MMSMTVSRLEVTFGGGTNARQLARARWQNILHLVKHRNAISKRWIDLVDEVVRRHKEPNATILMCLNINVSAQSAPTPHQRNLERRLIPTSSTLKGETVPSRGGLSVLIPSFILMMLQRIISKRFYSEPHQLKAYAKLEGEQTVPTHIAANTSSVPQIFYVNLGEKIKLAEEMWDQEHSNPPRSSYDRVEVMHEDIKKISDPVVAQILEQVSGSIWCCATDAKLEEIVSLKAVKPYVTGDGSPHTDKGMSHTLEPNGHEWRHWAESDDEGLSDGSSVTHEFRQAEEIYSKNAGRKRRTIDDDDLVTKLAPFIKQQIEDALNSSILPLVSILRSREEDEQKHREKMLALEEEKLALKREKLLFKRRRITLSQPAPPRIRSGYKKRHALRAKSHAL